MLSEADPPEVFTAAVAGSHVSPEVVEEHDKETEPVKPPDGVTETVDVALAPGLAIVA